MNKVLKSPFPYFGGKSRVADLVWDRLGNPDNYVEPFAGSLAVLLRRPETGKIETVNDKNHFIVNFWRAVKHDRAGVVSFADGPVLEADLHARHNWLLNSETSKEFRGQIETDPDFYDSKIAGWWVWGQCCWIGGGWCDSLGTNSKGDTEKRRPSCKADSLGTIHAFSKQLPDLSGDGGAFGRGVASSAGHNKKKPITVLGNSQFLPGVHAKSETTRVSLGRPQLGDARGVNSNKHAGTCDERKVWLSEWIYRLSDWNRICSSKTTMTRLGITGAFLDSPYAKNIERLQALIRGESFSGDARSTNRSDRLYAGDDDQDIDKVVADVNRWCQEWGRHKNVRIVVCGYEGEHNNLCDLGWDVEHWKASGGYGNRNSDNDNQNRERLWISPGCRKDKTLF